MVEKNAEVRANRCGFELQPGDVGLSDFEHAWKRLTRPVCCWHPIWESHNETDRCIWHADVDEKPLAELITAQADIPKRLDGALLRNLHVEGEELSFGDYSLHGAKFDNATLQEIDFTDTDLIGANFTYSNLRWVNFIDANLIGANFTHSDLLAPNFTGANLQRANFTDVKLGGADFTDADLLGTNFTYSDLSGANFTHSYLADADFTNVDLRNVDFIDANLTETDFTDADLRWADFTDADLRWADFTDADLREVDFTDADLREADFTDADLRDAELSDVDAREAIFRHATLQDAVFTRTDCRRAIFTNTHLYETVFSDIRVNSKTTFFDPETTFYDSVTSRPGCVYEENPRTTDQLPEDVQSLEAARWVYRRLETLHEDNALSEEARQFHFSKEEAERSLYWDRRKYGPWAVKTLMWYFTKHGESVKRVLIWWGIVIFAAGTLLPFVGGVTDADGTEYAITSLGELRAVAGWQDILMNIYFSVTTFSTIMDGGLAPAGTGTRAIVAVEAIMGALLVALLVFVLGRRTAR